MKFYNAAVKHDVLLKYHQLFPNNHLNILKSFGNITEEMPYFIKTDRDKFGGFILDSGVWTKNNAASPKAKEITVNRYRDYLLQYSQYFDFYFNFDDDFSENGFGNNQMNQFFLEKVGLKPVPVVHNIYDDEIDFFISKGYPRVALGSSQITNQNQMAHVMRRFDGTGIKIHLFGNSQFDFLAYFPIATADSTTSAKASGFGNILYWNPQKDGDNKTDLIYLDERLQVENKKKNHISNYKYREDLEVYLDKNFGLSHYDLCGREGNDNKALVNTHYCVQLEDVINQIHKKYGFDTAE